MCYTVMERYLCCTQVHRVLSAPTAVSRVVIFWFHSSRCNGFRTLNLRKTMAFIPSHCLISNWSLPCLLSGCPPRLSCTRAQWALEGTWISRLGVWLEVGFWWWPGRVRVPPGAPSSLCILAAWGGSLPRFCNLAIKQWRTETSKSRAEALFSSSEL